MSCRRFADWMIAADMWMAFVEPGCRGKPA
jgi:hypothetical protein